MARSISSQTGYCFYLLANGASEESAIQFLICIALPSVILHIPIRRSHNHHIFRFFFFQTMPRLTTDQDLSSTYSIDCLEDVHAVEFCTFEGCEQLLAYGGNKRLAVGVCHFTEEAHTPQFEHLTDFHHGTPVIMIAWSPRTSIQHLPHSLQWVQLVLM